MTHKFMTVKEVIEYLDENSDDIWHKGLRVAFRGDDYIPSKKFRKSFYHGDNEPEHRLDGVSAVGVSPNYDADEIVERICIARKYGENVFLLLGNDAEYGDDHHEVVMSDHKIVAIIPPSEFVKATSNWIDMPWAVANVTE